MIGWSHADFLPEWLIEKGRGIEWRQICGERQTEGTQSGPWNGRK